MYFNCNKTFKQFANNKLSDKVGTNKCIIYILCFLQLEIIFSKQKIYNLIKSCKLLESERHIFACTETDQEII